MAVQDDTQLRSKVEKMTGRGLIRLWRHESAFTRNSFEFEGRYPELGVAFCSALQRLENGECQHRVISDSERKRYQPSDYSWFSHMELINGENQLVIDDSSFNKYADKYRIILAFEYIKREYFNLIHQSLCDARYVQHSFFQSSIARKSDSECDSQYTLHESESKACCGKCNTEIKNNRTLKQWAELAKPAKQKVRQQWSESAISARRELLFEAYHSEAGASQRRVIATHSPHSDYPPDSAMLLDLLLNVST